MNFIKQLFETGNGKPYHHKFIRFGKGEFEKLFFTITKTKKNIKVKSSFDFANDFVQLIADNVNESIDVKGKIIAAEDFESKLDGLVDIKAYSKRGKLYTAEIEATLNPAQLKQLYEMFRKSFLLLNINSKDFKLKTGKSIPKPGGQLKPDFCSATLPLSMLDEFAWDVDKNFNKLEIKHIINVNEIIIPQDCVNDPARARIEAIRKGKIIRVLNIDGRSVTHEIKFEA